MATAYLTPKPTSVSHSLPACPPPPKAAHKAIDLQSLPALSLPCHFDFDDALSSCGGEGFFLAAPVVPKRSGAEFIPISSKRSRGDGLGAVALPFLKLKPRPSRNVGTSGPYAETSDGTPRVPSLTRSSSFQRAYRRSSDPRKPKLSKRPSFSRSE